MIIDVETIVAAISEHCQEIKDREDRDKMELERRNQANRVSPPRAAQQQPPRERQYGRRAERDSATSSQPEYPQPQAQPVPHREPRSENSSFSVDDRPRRADVVIVRQEVSHSVILVVKR